MIRMNPALFAALQNGMSCDQCAVLEDADLVSERMDLDHPASRSIRNAVGVAANADHALPRHPAFQLQNGSERGQRQWSQVRPLLCKGFIDDAKGGGMLSWIGDGVQPVPELGIQVIKITELSIGAES